MGIDAAWDSADTGSSTATAPTDTSADSSQSSDQQGNDAFRSASEPAASAGAGDAVPTAANIAEAQSPDAISREDGAVWIGNAGSSGRWFKDGRFVAGERPANAPPRTVPSAPSATGAGAPAPGDAFWFPRNGERVPIPDSFINRETGDLTIKASQVHELRETLAEAARMADWPERERQYEERFHTAVANEREYANGWKEIANQLFEVVRNPDRLAAFLENHDREADLLLRQLSQRAPRVPQEPEAPSYDPERIATAAHTALDEELDLLLEAPDAKRLFGSEEDRNDIREAFRSRMAVYFSERGNDLLLNQSALRRDFEREVKRIQRYRQGATPKPSAPSAPPRVPSTVPAKGATTTSKPIDKVKWAKDHGFA